MKDSLIDDTTLSKNEFLNPLMPGSSKRSYILKVNSSFWLWVCLSMFDLSQPPGMKVVRNLVVRNLSFVLEIPYSEFDDF